LFDVLYDTATRQILGVGTDAGEGYAIARLEDDALLQEILDADTGATLGADGQSITTPQGTFRARAAEVLEAERAAAAPAAEPARVVDPGSW
jgi:hypothetical protein